VRRSCLFTRQDLLGDSEAFTGTLESLAVFVTLGIADLAFERFDGFLQVFDKLAHDSDRRRLIFDLDGDPLLMKFVLTKRGQSHHRSRMRRKRKPISSVRSRSPVSNAQSPGNSVRR
jgi:hypothetical protein